MSPGDDTLEVREVLDGQPDDAANVLLLAPSLGEDVDEACTGLLTVAPTEGLDVLYLTFTMGPDRRLEVWGEHADGPPARMGIIGVDEADGPGDGEDSTPAYVTVERVNDPADLTGVGIEFGQFLSEWSGDGNRIVACIHSITALLQYADLKRVFRFLHVLTERLRTVDAVAHYHLDPNAHDAQTVATLTSLFDAVVTLDDDEPTVRTR